MIFLAEFLKLATATILVGGWGRQDAIHESGPPIAHHPSQVWVR